DGDFARICELNRVADEIDEDLSQAATIATAGRQFGRHLDLKGELLVCRQRLKGATDGLGDVLNRVIGQFENQLTGLDLGKVEHVIDESKQVLAVGLKAFEYAKHLLGWLAVSAVRHQFGVAQDGVERRAQLMAHIGEELRLVLARFFKLAALVLDFVKQPNVFDGNRGLISKGLNQRDLLVGERLDLRFNQTD